MQVIRSLENACAHLLSKWAKMGGGGSEIKMWGFFRNKT